MKHCPQLVRIALLGGLLGALPGAGACKSEPASTEGAATSPDDTSASGTGTGAAAGSADQPAQPASGGDGDGDADADAEQAEASPALTALAGEAVGMPESPERPRFSPDGRWIAFHGGPEGARHIFVMPYVRPGGAGQPGARFEVKQVTRLDGDSRDPAWSPDGTRLVFANNAAGHYDLHVMPLTGGAPERITDWPGDELEPVVAPIRFAFYAVFDDSCTAEGASGNQVDGYEKIAFTRRHGQPAREEVWFVSMRPGDAATVRMAHDEAALSAHAAHKGLLSPKGKQCRAPSFSGDGLSLVWTCDSGGPVVYDGEARWEQSFKAALASVSSEPVPACQPESYDQAACFAKLPRRYTRFVGPAVSKPSEGLARPSVSTNQILLVADAGGRPMYRDRGRKNAPWQPIVLDQGTAGAAGDATGSPSGAAAGSAAPGARNVVWSPDGSGIAFDAASATGRTIATAPTHFYLQEVRNLNRFPLLHGKGQSRKLQQNRFLARPGTNKEFYALYEQLRYGRVPQYVTADAALQVYRDEFIRLLQDAEKKASEHLRGLSKALLDVYAARLDQGGQAGARASAQDRYLAVYFAAAWVVLETAATMEQLDPDAYLYAAHSAGDGADPEEAARFAELSRPPIERMPAAIPAVLAKLPAAIRQDVAAHIDAMLAHAGVGDLVVPGRPRPARVDWSQFKVRGPYAESELAGYFLAMSWYAQAPLPLDASLEALLRTMESGKLDGRSLMDTWSAVDAMVGAFMGKPVDATMAHLAEVRAESPALLSPFDAEAVAKRLEALRGPMPLRDAEAVESNQGARKIQVTFFPKRMGLDTTFFRALTHPDVPLRGMPSALDIMAVLGSERAHEHAIAASAAAADAVELTEAYRKALDALIVTRRAEGLPATDIYHAWLAALVALATAHDVPADSLMTFARTEAWQDRLLLSALGGYTQLKHAATLYNMQDMSAECGDDASYYLLVEQPIQPVPHGFVDPVPAFFDALAGVADRVYQVMHDDPAGPETPFWYDDSEVPLNARNFARDLARIARREVEGKPLRPADLRWIELVGARLEALTLNMPSSDGAQSIGAQARAERGIALATDIHTNLMRGQALQLAIGRIMDFWVAVPDGVGQTMTQGGIFSFYEFTQPMSDRLDDAQWAERVAAGKQPPLPAWTDSFVGPAIR